MAVGRLARRFLPVLFVVLAVAPAGVGGLGLVAGAPAAEAYSSACSRAFGHSPHVWHIRVRGGKNYCVRSYYVRRCVTVQILPGWTKTECRTHGPYYTAPRLLRG